MLVVADGGGLARVRACVDEAVASRRQVTLLLGVPGAADVLPSSLLPDEAEYVVATEDGSLGHHGSVIDLVTEYEAWADQCFAAGSEALLARMARLANGREARMGVARLGRKRGRRPDPPRTASRRRAWLQVALSHPAGCALGVCLGCAAEGTQGTPARVPRGTGVRRRRAALGAGTVTVELGPAASRRPATAPPGAGGGRRGRLRQRAARRGRRNRRRAPSSLAASRVRPDPGTDRRAWWRCRRPS